MVKRKPLQKHYFFMKIDKNAKKNMQTAKRFACCIKRGFPEANREESPRKGREKRAPRRSKKAIFHYTCCKT